MKTVAKNFRVFAAIGFGVLAATAASGESNAKAAPAESRGGRVGWARLVTPNTAWRRHAEFDDVLSKFIRTHTSLNIDPTWISADPTQLDQLCR